MIVNSTCILKGFMSQTLILLFQKTMAEALITICPVCSDKNPKGHNKSYGAHVCSSCRAFFRRYHQKNEGSAININCKKGDQCEITVQNRRSCQKCRYEKCIQCGMNPCAVMTLEERKAWFQMGTFQRKSKKGKKLFP